MRRGSETVEKLLTTGEVAQRLGVNQTTVAQWAKDGRFPNAQRMGKRQIWIIPESDLEELKRNPSPGTRRKLSWPDIPIRYAAWA